MSDSRIIAEEKANELDRAIGAIPIGKYIRSNLKREYQCTKCNNLYLNTHKDTKRRHVTTCPKCSAKIRGQNNRHTIEYIHSECRKRGFEPLFTQYSNIDQKKKVCCKCGKIANISLCAIILQNQKTCGHCNDPKMGDRFGKLTVINIKTSNSIGCSIQCKCDCGNILKWTNAYNIIGGNIKSCGYCNNAKVGDKYGELEVIEVILGSKGKGCQAKCQCSCGKIVVLKHSRLKSNNNTSCGHCGLKRNSRFTSYTALKLHNLIEKLTQQKWEHKCVQ